MAKGKKYNDDVKERAFALLAVNNNVAAVAKEMNLPYSTVKTWEKAWLKSGSKKEGDTADKDSEYTSADEKSGESKLAKLRDEKKRDFIDKAWSVIGEAGKLIERRIRRALESEDEIDRLLEEICELDYDDLDANKRKELYRKVSKIRLDDLKELAVVLGTLYDKQALANKEPTAINSEDTIIRFEDL